MKAPLQRCAIWGAIGLLASAPARAAGETPSAELDRINATLNWQRVDPAGYAAPVERLLAKWAQADPAAALEFALRPLEDDNVHALFLEGAGNLMQDWALRDPVSARLFFESLKSGKAAEILAAPLLQGYATRAPESALEWVHTCPASLSAPAREAMARSVAAVYDRLGRREQLSRWLALPEVADSAAGKSAAADLARYLARSSPKNALAFVQLLPAGTPARSQAMLATFHQWSAGNPAEALTHAQSLTDSALRNNVLEALRPKP